MTEIVPAPAESRIVTPETSERRPYWDAQEAVAEVIRLYGRSVAFLSDSFDAVLKDGFVVNGPKFVGGDSGGLANQVSVNYSF